MPKLTARQVATLQPRATLYRLADGHGLMIEVPPTGSRRWRVRYRLPDGREQMLSLGRYPEVSLAEAREALAEVRRALREGRDPAAERREARQAPAIAAAEAEAAAAELAASEGRRFEAVAEQWLAAHGPNVAPATRRKMEYVTREYLARLLAGVDVGELGTVETRRAVAAIAARAPSLAAKARGYVTGVLDFATHEGLRDESRAMPNLRAVIPRRPTEHLPASTDTRSLRAVLRAVRGYESEVTRRALELLAATAVRPGVVAGARWAEFELDAKAPDGTAAPLWSIPGERMKTGLPHLVPLSRQAVENVRAMEKFTAGGEYVFPPLAKQKTPHLHRDALSNALRRLGFQNAQTAHGFRASFRTIARERLGVAPDVLEVALAHTKKGPNGGAYDRAQFLTERRDALQRWADLLDELRAESDAKA